MIKKYSAEQKALYAKFAADTQKDQENAIEIGFAKAAIDAGLSEAEYTRHFKYAVEKLQKQAAAKA
jgi:hypothetical protein